jgi:hypothetical protein
VEESFPSEMYIHFALVGERRRDCGHVQVIIASKKKEDSKKKVPQYQYVNIYNGYKAAI